MTIGEVRDIVRELVERFNIPAHVLNYAMGRGRREIENRENFYWMSVATPKDWSTVDGQQGYSVTLSTSNGLGITNFKDIRILGTKTTSDTAYSEVDTDPPLEELAIAFATDDKGQPEVAILENDTLLLFPPDPDAVFDMRLYYWQWTANPTANGTSDELTTRWPEALIYGATMAVHETKKDLAGAQYWEKMMEKEIVKIHRYNIDRAWPSRFELTPRTGPFLRNRDRKSVIVWR